LVVFMLLRGRRGGSMLVRAGTCAVGSQYEAEKGSIDLKDES